MARRIVTTVVVLVCAVALAAGLSMAARSAEAAARPCKPCKDRPWCGCSYNGMPRVSCNPCCYGHQGIPQICMD